MKKHLTVKHPLSKKQSKYNTHQNRLKQSVNVCSNDDCNLTENGNEKNIINDTIDLKSVEDRLLIFIGRLYSNESLTRAIVQQIIEETKERL